MDRTDGYLLRQGKEDKDGRERACYPDDIKGKARTREEMSEDETRNCLEVSQIVGIERW